MNRKQGRLFLSFNAVDEFLDSHAEEIPKTIRSGSRERFRQALARVKEHIRMQAGAPLSAQSLTAWKEEKRQALMRDFMAPIVRIARSEGSAVPGLEPLKMPRGTLGEPKLIAYASGMLDVARGHQELFIGAGMPADFVEQFQHAIDDVANSLDARANERGAGRGATVGLEVALRQCKKLRDVLDTFIHSELVNQPALLANWRSVKRVHRLASRATQPAIGPVEQSIALPVAVETVVAVAASDVLASVVTGQLSAPLELPVRDPARLIAVPLRDVHSAIEHPPDVQG